jgi:succinate-semialdehyde dehydrogenase / glutarate-semialdehyde dehydrogenase
MQCRKYATYQGASRDLHRIQAATAYAFTNSARNVDRLAEGVELGNLSINHFVALSAETPFGGVKDSGFGREGGIEGLHCYTVAKNSHLTA